MKKKRLVWFALAAASTLGLAGALWLIKSTQSPGRLLTSGSPPTFNKDIAPILFQRCAPCHRRGQAAPFELLTYADVKKRADDIARVTARRLMPPWLPDPGDGPFVGQRSLSAGQIAAETLEEITKTRRRALPKD